jgi:uncharacterized protein
MSIPEIDAFFKHVAQFYAEAPQKMDFVWHGGEPLLQDISYYNSIFELQHRYFDPVNIPFKNSIQTNLTLLNDEKTLFLRDNFENIGVSVDLFGDLRVTAGGRPSQPIVLENMQRLIDSGIRFGCITVLSGHTASKVESIFEFYYELGIAFRLLPIYRTGFKDQHSAFGLSDEDIVNAFKKVADLWIEMDGFLQVRPIQDYVSNVLLKYAEPHLQSNFYSQNTGENLFIIDTDGGVYSNADAYTPKLCYGNIFLTPLHELLKGPAYNQVVSNRKDRIRLTCEHCRFYGACSGFFMGEATPEQRYLNEKGDLKCAIAYPLHSYIEQRFIERGIIDTKSQSLDRSKLPLSQSHSKLSQSFEI